MEDWQIDFEWLKVRHYIKDALNHEKLPDFQAVLFLIGVQELGRIPGAKFTKEEKQDLMHVAVCTLLDGEYYEFEGRDQDGWPHFKVIKKMDLTGLEDQERYLKIKIIEYLSL
ncbi:MAG TPA: hypothetical protein PLZ32_07305 [Saprospiraceae bacterium]|nr:hypothetical protein [Saprospiraceae bacterium]